MPQINPLYKILLVDDEVDVRESIARTVDWAAHGFSLCGCAAGALEAMELARRLLPDVVMTDICMPYMDGLEMIDRLKQVHPAMQFVVVSGHDDFAYAQRALQFQVMDYLLKPLSAEGIFQALDKIRARLDARMAQRNNLKGIQEQLEQYRSQNERMHLMELILDAEAEPIDAALDEKRFPARLAVVGPDESNQNERVAQEVFQGRQDLLHFSVHAIAQELLADEGQGPCVLHRGRLVMLLRGTVDEAAALLNKIMDTLRMYLHLSVKAALSSETAHASALAALYQRTLLLFGCEATFASGSLFLMEETAPENRAQLLADSLPGEVVQLLRGGGRERIDSYFSQLRARLNEMEVSPALLESLSSVVIAAVFTTSMRAGLAQEAFFPVLSQYRLRYPLETEAVLSSLCQLVQAAALRMEEHNRLQSKQLASSIADYIQQHFQEPDLSIASVCEVFRISQTQLSLLFKREMGTSFLQYVLDLRIRRAQHLLSQTDKKIYEIALETGFEDPGYFSYCFKQRCGMTPKNFRSGAGAHA